MEDWKSTEGQEVNKKLWEESVRKILVYVRKVNVQFFTIQQVRRISKFGFDESFRMFL